jgi:GT2 family glycosyltransferase
MTSAQEASVSVVIPTYRRRASVKRALHALSRQTLANDAFEVIVSIDGSDDGTREMLREFPTPYRLRSSWQPNRGRAAACNAGVSLADRWLIVFLDDDMEPAPQCLEAHLRAHEPELRVGVMGAAPVVIESRAPPATKYMAAKFNQHLERLADAGHRFALRDFYSGNFSVPRALLLEIGGFDEDFKVYGNEDLELYIRLTRAGLRIVYDPDAIAWQHHTKSFAELARDAVAKGRTAVLLAGKHPGALPELQLSAYRSASLKWRLLRSCLLRINAPADGTPSALIRLVEQLERIHAPFLGRIYKLALDYFYWVGALAMVRENRQLGRGLTILPNIG